MERIKKLIEALNSEKITGMLYEYYEDNDYALKPKWKCSKRFTKYFYNNINKISNFSLHIHYFKIF